jgi:molybdopterin converting factor small subunit
MPTINIPLALRPQTDNQPAVDTDGDTVGHALKNLCTQHPALGQRLYQDGDTAGQLNRFINVYVDDEDIRFLDNLETPVDDKSDVLIQPAIAGG